MEGGADRIELCTALSEGGLTPAASLIRLCRDSFHVPLFPIIRPREGDFLYNGEEYLMMLRDVAYCRALGCEGVVFGMLEKDGQIDRKRCVQLRETAYPMEVTFHRAFDRCRDPFEALACLVEEGFDRILTSGQQQVATDGLPLIRSLVETADGRISVMPGSGVRPENVRSIAEQTGASEFHASLRQKTVSDMEYIHPSFAGSDDYRNPSVLAAAVSALKAALD